MSKELFPNRFWSRYSLPDRTIQELKQICKILFVDDGEFSVPDILINSGWNETKKLDDVESLDAPEIIGAHIIFVDISGVGKRLEFSDEGLGLISALKQKYPIKKVVVYSAQRRGDRFHEGLSSADARLPKNADPFQFENVVETFAKEAFSLTGVVTNLQEVIERDFKIHLSEEEIHRALRTVGRKKNYSDVVVAKAFSLSNLGHAGSLASIISLFLRG